MPAKRIIPCLDVKNGRVVKGVHFRNLRDAGDPVEAAARYDAQGADEITYLDISATLENRGTLLDLVSRTAARVFAPLTVGGGVRSEEDFVAAPARRAPTRSRSTPSAVADPGLVDRLSRLAGAQALVVAIDVKRRPPVAGRDPEWEVYVAGGTRPTGVEGIAWAREVARRGARARSCSPRWTATARWPATTWSSWSGCAAAVGIPVIASGGVGTLEHLAEGLRFADAALAASIFHDGKHTVDEAKAYLRSRGIEVRP